MLDSSIFIGNVQSLQNSEQCLGEICEKNILQLRNALDIFCEFVFCRIPVRKFPEMRASGYFLFEVKCPCPGLLRNLRFSNGWFLVDGVVVDEMGKNQRVRRSRIAEPIPDVPTRSPSPREISRVRKPSAIASRTASSMALAASSRPKE